MVVRRFTLAIRLQYKAAVSFPLSIPHSTMIGCRVCYLQYAVMILILDKKLIKGLTSLTQSLPIHEEILSAQQNKNIVSCLLHMGKHKCSCCR